MHITTSRGFRRSCIVVAIFAWLASVAIIITAMVVGKHYTAHLALLFCLTVAATATITGLLGSSLAPIAATYRHVYDAGWQDCAREQIRAVVVPESRMQDKREIKLDAS